MTTADLGLIGLAVMGQNLALNFTDHGYTVAVHNRTTTVTDGFIAGPGAGRSLVACHDLESLVAAVRRPRRIMLMVKAGPVVDSVIEELKPFLEPGDIIIDGGNSLFSDSERRVEELAADDLWFVGSGVSGGEEGARNGPSIMPGGNEAAAELVMPMLRAVAARADDGEPCAAWLGPGGAGHYVKMVHNGIEYGDMQVIAEAYSLMKAMGLSHEQMAETFAAWGAGVLDSFLIDITADIVATSDDDGTPLVEKILDAAGQKGTGKWTVISAMDLGQPVTLVSEAVSARILSSMKDQRVRASEILGGPDGSIQDQAFSLDDLRDAVYGSKIVSYAQGFLLLDAASEEHGWGLDLGVVAGLWRAGCIIRAAFLEDITKAFNVTPGLESLLVDPSFAAELARVESGWRRVVAAAVSSGVPVPAYATALSFYDGYRTGRGSANMIQAQRDYFGAHTYERIDQPRGEFFHTNWTGTGGDTTSGSYNA
ncbi:MAG: decarboxylating NADP(+)-dependent phosphogluconate dehydrogenase [Acidimicrobiales bacterium]